MSSPVDLNRLFVALPRSPRPTETNFISAGLVVLSSGYWGKAPVIPRVPLMEVVPLTPSVTPAKVTTASA